ncbi:MAG: hypothetical protein EZS28_046698, partial [Streblomastix strix]
AQVDALPALPVPELANGLAVDVFKGCTWSPAAQAVSSPILPIYPSFLGTVIDFGTTSSGLVTLLFYHPNSSLNTHIVPDSALYAQSPRLAIKACISAFVLKQPLY